MQFAQSGTTLCAVDMTSTVSTFDTTAPPLRLKNHELTVFPVWQLPCPSPSQERAHVKAYFCLFGRDSQLDFFCPAIGANGPARKSPECNHYRNGHGC